MGTKSVNRQSAPMCSKLNIMSSVWSGPSSMKGSALCGVIMGASPTAMQS